jgi:hypothetical protein
MVFSKISLLPIALCLLHGTAWSQTMPESYPAERYLPPLAAAERATSAVLPADKLRHAFQDLGTKRSFVGDTEGAIAAYDLAWRTDGPRATGKEPVLPDGLQAEDAIRAIVEQARSKRVVLINEAHHVPMNRAFTQKLAAQLRKIGYTYLACETFDSDRGDISKHVPGQATVYTGYYIREPVFAGFVNAALADGWKLVPYEYLSAPGDDPKRRIEAREEGQARNLVERIFARDKDARVLIHVGYGHLHKSRPDNANMPVMMGEYLHRMTGLDMLHVDQARFFSHPDPASESPMYARLVEKFPATEPFVLRAADGTHPVLLGMQGSVDMQVIFPRYASHDGRPDWMRTLAGRTPRPIPPELLPKQGRRLIKAFRAGDRPDAVPADMVLAEAGKPAPALMLPAGEFRYAYEDD